MTAAGAVVEVTARPLSLVASRRRPPLPLAARRRNCAWLEICRLVVDPVYQREWRARPGQHRAHRAGILLGPMFAPVIVAPVGRRRYAIIDGPAPLDRGAAARPRPRALPDRTHRRGDAADAFAAINASSTPITSCSSITPASAAGDALALERRRHARLPAAVTVNALPGTGQPDQARWRRWRRPLAGIAPRSTAARR